jgi:hypothetical protein
LVSFGLSGDGYSLLRSQGETEFQRVDWEFGTVFPPCAQQFHQHFVTSNHASRYLATGLGGDQIEYEDQDPRIHALWLEEMRKRRITPKLELPKKAS